MPALIAMVGGGIKGAVAAARYAVDHELVFVHVAHGQAALSRQRAALKNLCRAYPGARVLAIDIGDARDLGDAGSQVGRRTGQAGREPADDPAGRPGDARGLLPAILSIGVRHAVRLGAHRVVTGVSQTIDEAQRGAAPGEGRPDHRREFIHAFNIMSQTALTRRARVVIEAPLMDLTYPEVIRLAVRLQVPLEATWTCERGDPQPCGRCEPCVARSNAFASAAMTDPLPAASARIG